jgi:hypothetical protein
MKRYLQNPINLVLISERESHGTKAASDSRFVGMFIKEPFSASFK